MMPELEIYHISKSYFYKKEETPALVDISISIQKGEFVSLIGPSGCGKSTLLEIISGLIKPDVGEILLHDFDIKGKPGHVSFMPQDDTLFPWRTIMDNVILPLEIDNVKKNIAIKEAESYFELFGLANYENKRPFMLSGGMRQRAAFLRTFLGKKEMLLLDEPFAKLDALTRMKMQKWLLDIWSHFGYSVLMVTHDIEEAVWMSDRIYVMSGAPGRIIAEEKIPFARPRIPHIRFQPEFLALKTELTVLLGEEA